MPAIARANGFDTVFSRTGSRRGCNFPTPTVTGDATETSVVIGPDLIPAVVFGDRVGSHPQPGCGPDVRTLFTHSSTVFIRGKGVGRIGDQYGADADNIITSGFETVFVGG